MFIELIAIIVAVLVVIVTYYKWAFKYWERRGLPSLPPSFPFGNLENPLNRKRNLGVHAKLLYDKLKSGGHKHAGIYFFTLPEYLPIDPEIIKNILQRDFQHFVERGFYHNEKDDPLSAHLFAIGGQKWRNLRTKLTPTFTSGKMKMMFDTLVTCSDQMGEAMDNFHNTKQAIDIKDVLACYTTDIIGSCAFGLDCNSFKSPDAEFRKYGRRIFKSRSALESLRILFAFSQPNLGRALGIRFFPKESTDFFMKVVKDTVNYREKNNFVRKDMLQLLIEIKNNHENGEILQESKHDGNTLTIEELAAQAFVFFVAGFETSSTTMTFCLYELATHPDIQQKVRDEINEVLAKHNWKITYDSIMDMKYMNQVIDETLRKYPPLPFITRECVNDYKVPGTDVVIEKGTRVNIPILGLHHDPEHYPNPEKFDPERFSDENKKQRNPFTFMPFGEGPRICIGLRFGIMQTKVGLTALLKNYKFSLHKSTVNPFIMDRHSFILTSETGIFLDIDKVEATHVD